MINNKLLTLFQGKCWHKWEWDAPMTEVTCSICTKKQPEPDKVDFSDPAQYMPFLHWFWKEKPEMWGEAHQWILTKWMNKPYDYDPTRWLFSFDDNNEPRIMSLLSGWLSLPGVRGKWGWVDCPEYEPFCVPVCSNPCLCKNGKIRAEWAKDEVTSGKTH